MKYCKKCVQPNTRPSVRFDKEGVCMACRFAEVHNKINWKARRKELSEIAEYGRRNNVSSYDCIVGVSGGKDSVRQSLYVRDELGLKPLLVSCNYPPEQLTERGVHNISNLISMGFDCINVQPDPKIWKKLMLQGFLKYANWCKSTEMALYASVPKVAIAYHIPLIFLGESDAMAFGTSDDSSDTGIANGMKYCNTLKGGDPKANRLVTKDMKSQNLFWYHYPSDEELEWGKLKIIFLGYYIKDFTRFKNAELAVQQGLKIRNEKPEDIGDLYGFSALDDDFVIVNQMLKYIKLGFGQVTDQVSEAIRLGMITRKQGIELVKKYDGKCADRFIEKFCRYLGISKKKFLQVVDLYRNKDIFYKNKKGEFKIKFVLD